MQIAARLTNRTWWFSKDTAARDGKAREKETAFAEKNEIRFLRFSVTPNSSSRSEIFTIIAAFENARGLNYTCTETKRVNIINHPFHCSETCTHSVRIKTHGNVIFLELC